MDHKLHNKYNLEVVRNGETIQEIESYNTLTNKFFEVLPNLSVENSSNSTYGSYKYIRGRLCIGDGSGTHTPDSTTLFNQLYDKECYLNGYQLGGSHRGNVFTFQAKYTLAENELVGKNLTEIGYKYDYSTFMSLSALKDKHGSPISIQKTDVDVIYITYTLYIEINLKSYQQLYVGNNYAGLFLGWRGSIFGVETNGYDASSFKKDTSIPKRVKYTGRVPSGWLPKKAGYPTYWIAQGITESGRLPGFPYGKRIEGETLSDQGDHQNFTTHLYGCKDPEVFVNGQKRTDFKHHPYSWGHNKPTYGNNCNEKAGCIAIVNGNHSSPPISGDSFDNVASAYANIGLNSITSEDMAVFEILDLTIPLEGIYYSKSYNNTGRCKIQIYTADTYGGKDVLIKEDIVDHSYNKMYKFADIPDLQLKKYICIHTIPFEDNMKFQCSFELRTLGNKGTIEFNEPLQSTDVVTCNYTTMCLVKTSDYVLDLDVSWEWA